MKSARHPRIADIIDTHTLPNGLQICVSPNRRAPVFSAYMAVATGSMHEEEFLGCGLSHFLEHMLFTGTRNFPGATEIADRAGALGARINAWTASDHTVYYMEAPSAALEKVLDMLCDMVSDPLFPEDLFQREKDVILRECAMRDDNPHSVLFQTMLDTLYRTSPCRIPVIGIRECIETVGRDMMRTYYQRRYSPHRCFLSVCGDAAPDTVFTFLERKLGAWKRHGIADPVLPPEPPFRGIRRQTGRIHDTFARQSQGFLLTGAGLDDLLKMNVVCEILTGSESSRLVSELRSRRELVSDVTLHLYGSHGAEACFASIETAPEKLSAAAETLQEQLRLVRDGGTTQQELDRARRIIRTDRLNIFRKNSLLARALCMAAVRAGSPDMIDTDLELIDKLTADDLSAALRKFLRFEDCALVSILPDTAQKKTVCAATKETPPAPVLHHLPGRRKGIVLTDPRTPFLSFTAMLHGGIAYTDRNTAGYANLLSSVLFCGAGKYSEDEFNRALDDLAVQLHVESGVRGLCIRMEAEKDVFPEAMRLLTLMLAEPAFAEKPFEREKEDFLRTIGSAVMRPAAAALDSVHTSFFKKGNPFSFGIAEISDAIRNASPEKMRDYLSRVVLTAPGTCFSLAGPCTEKQALKFIGDFLKALPWSGKAPKAVRAETAGAHQERILRTLPCAQAVPIRLFPHPDISDPAVILPALLLNSALSGMSSPLFKNIREAEGLAYHVSAEMISGYGQSALAFLAGTRPDAVERVFRKFKEEQRRLAKHGLTDEEFEHARTHLGFVIASCMQDSAEIASFCAKDEYMGTGMDTRFRLLRELPHITRRTVNAFIRTIFSSDDAAEVLVMPENFAKKMKIS